MPSTSANNRCWAVATSMLMALLTLRTSTQHLDHVQNLREAISWPQHYWFLSNHTLKLGQLRTWTLYSLCLQCSLIPHGHTSLFATFYDVCYIIQQHSLVYLYAMWLYFSIQISLSKISVIEVQWGSDDDVLQLLTYLRKKWVHEVNKSCKQFGDFHHLMKELCEIDAKL